MGILRGLKILEFEGIGPSPFCGMLFADMGADVILVQRPDKLPRTDNDHLDILNRGKRAILVDLKSGAGRETALALVRRSNGLIEGYRPGVMERLGLGPEVCLKAKPSLAYGRATGWGQTGPLALTAGHDINYIALSGALWYGGEPGSPPWAPPTLLGDIAGGALHLALGMLAALWRAQQSGRGDVIDAAMVDGSAYMMNFLHNIAQAGRFHKSRGESELDGSPWYRSYLCRDGEWITVGALEDEFYKEFLKVLGLEKDPMFLDRRDKSKWAHQVRCLADIFGGKDSGYWSDKFKGTDACFAQVMHPRDAAAHQHIADRHIYLSPNDVFQAAPSPRFQSQPPWSHRPAPTRGQHTQEILAELSSQPPDDPC